MLHLLIFADASDKQFISNLSSLILLSNPNKSLTCSQACSWKEYHQKQSHDQQDM